MRVFGPLAFAVAASTWMLSAWAVQPLSVEYSADYVFETAEMAQAGKVYAAPGKERREGSAEGMTTVTIRRDDLGKFYMLMPSERMYMEFSAGESDPSGARADDPGDYAVDMTELGPEELEGMRTVKYKVVMTDKDGSKMGGFWWITADGIPVKMDMLAIEEGSKVRLKQALSNIVIGPQPADLFEVPPGYSGLGMSLGKGLVGGMLGMPADDEDGGDTADDAPPEPKKKGFGLGKLKETIDKIR